MVPDKTQPQHWVDHLQGEGIAGSGKIPQNAAREDRKDRERSFLARRKDYRVVVVCPPQTNPRPIFAIWLPRVRLFSADLNEWKYHS